MQSEEYKEIARKLALLEQHVINLIVPIQNISHNLANPHIMRDLLKIFGSPIQIDDRALGGLIKQFREVANDFKKELEHVNIKQVFDEMKYIGNRLKGLEEKVSDIQKEQRKKEVRLRVCVEGQESSNESKDPLKVLLNSLPSFLQSIIIHRSGLFGEKPKTYKEIAKIMDMSGQTISIYHKQALRKLRHADLKELRENVQKVDLKLIGV